MSSNISSAKSLECWRDRPPFSYTIKVKNFTKLQSSTVYSDGKYQSRRFSSGDYKWRLIIYLKGNEKDNGSGFISMYVELDTTSLTEAKQTEVYADLRVFVFNKKENKYFTIQDVESRRFNALRTTWGFSQVLLLDTFSNHINGYLFDGDHCEFGVDITVAPPPTKLEIVSIDENLGDPKFPWTINNFFEINGNPRISEVFSVGGKEWVIKLYPRGFSSAYSKWISIFLHLADSETLKEDEKIYVQANLRVEDPRGCTHKTRQLNWWFDQPCGRAGSGWRQFVSIAELRESYLGMGNTWKIEIEFKSISATIFSSLT